MWAKGDIGGSESENIVVVWSREERREGASPIENIQLASGRMSSTRKTQEVDELDSGGYVEAGNQ